LRVFQDVICFVLVAISTFCAISISGQTPQPADPMSYGMTSGRLAAIIGAIAGLIGVIIGALALIRPGSGWAQHPDNSVRTFL
jgi:hypothetical protein